MELDQKRKRCGRGPKLTVARICMGCPLSSSLGGTRLMEEDFVFALLVRFAYLEKT